MSQGGAALLKEEMEFGRPVTDEQVEIERQEIMVKVKELENEGKIQVREKKKISVFESEDATSPLMPSLPEEDRFSEREEPQAQPAAPAASAEEIQNYLAYGEQLYGESRYEEALPYLQYAAEMDPSNARALQVLGHCQYGLGKTAEALQCYETALSLSPEDEALREWVEQFKQGANA
jgi:tetratricopeptide (TPR) repeat protein